MSSKALGKSKDLRDFLTNILYRTPQLVEPRSALVRASAAICGCDGTLCRMMTMGKIDQAHELGRRVEPLSAELTQLRLQLRRGHGAAILPRVQTLVDEVVALLGQIRAQV